ncbi:hypothetical protein B0T10DRAFT_453609 [Thelonectria olida]|uniref:Uncharacterized protein n=1 Tax=Thelonectria olida TaxID=1576542 RepID=A0A9P9AXZ5_9HYPO|nr:hypothetical protein B0T10DRAFT_453609 [Thelonectria olida]
MWTTNGVKITRVRKETVSPVSKTPTTRNLEPVPTTHAKTKAAPDKLLTTDASAELTPVTPLDAASGLLQIGLIALPIDVKMPTASSPRRSPTGGVRHGRVPETAAHNSGLTWCGICALSTWKLLMSEKGADGEKNGNETSDMSGDDGNGNEMSEKGDGDEKHGNKMSEMSGDDGHENGNVDNDDHHHSRCRSPHCHRCLKTGSGRGRDGGNGMTWNGMTWTGHEVSSDVAITMYSNLVALF